MNRDDMTKPEIFIASSRENIETARTIQDAFDYDALVTTWDQDIFGPSEYPLESLEKELDQADFGIFIFFPDDVTLMRGEELNTARDNVIFELGLFVGRLTRRRTFILTPRGLDIHLPSDLTGITPVEYDPNRTDGNLLAAIGPAARKIRKVIKALGARLKPEIAGLIEGTSEPTPTEPVVTSASVLLPSSEWERLQYEHALFAAIVTGDHAGIIRLDTAFKNSPYAEDESLAEWEGYKTYLQMFTGTQGAITNLQEKVAAYPRNPKLLRWLGEAYAHYGDNARAVEMFKGAIAAASNIEEAEPSVNRLAGLRGSPQERLDYPSLHSRLLAFKLNGQAQQRALLSSLKALALSANLKQIAQGIDEVRIRDKPDDGFIRFGLAYEYGESFPDLALLHYENIPQSERSAMAWNNLGVAYSGLGMPGLAVTAYEAASTKGETLADANLANLLINAGFFTTARRQLDTAIKIQNHHANVVTALNRIESAVQEEQNKVQQARTSASQRRIYFETLGLASATAERRSILGLWQTPDGIIEVKLEGGNQYVGSGEVKREVQALMLFSPKRHDVTLIELRLRRLGEAFEGTINRRPSEESSSTILGSFGRENAITLYFAEDDILMGQIHNFEKERILWTRVVSAPIVAGLLPETPRQ
ncbi:MAG: hypothetical protein EOR60_27260 [Mesorhizobium sp.]|nr:MAG: hypothetical protein EOR60_27260 [Mesorhizobium sp.]